MPLVSTRFSFFQPTSVDFDDSAIDSSWFNVFLVIGRSVQLVHVSSEVLASGLSTLVPGSVISMPGPPTLVVVQLI